MTSYLLAAPRFRICHLQRIMWRSSRERGPRDVLVDPSAALPHRVRREFSRERRQSERALENIPVWLGGVAPPLPFGCPAFGVAPVPYIPVPTVVRGPEDMLSSLLRQHILNYEPPHDFAIPQFAMYDGSSDPYDHMLHFN